MYKRQTVKELEIICVDDGSKKDQSAERSGQAPAGRCKIILHQQENRGQQLRGNVGDSAGRRRIYRFLDADDYYRQEDALRQMIGCCEKNQVKACGSVMYLFAGRREASSVSQTGKEDGRGRDYCYRNYQLDYDFTTFIFKREMILEDHIRFRSIVTLKIRHF